MSAKIILLRPADGKAMLIPASQHDMDELTAAIAPGRDCLGTLTQPRSLPQHRFYWGLLALCVKNHDFYRTTQALHIYLKTKMGLVEYIEFHDGRTHIHVGSTSFEKMDGISFGQYLNSCVDLIITDILPGVHRLRLIAEVERMVGITWQSMKTKEAA
jgi:hypothetical protein